MLHQAIFLNGSLVNMETWPNFNENRMEQFERVEQGFLRKVLSVHEGGTVGCGARFLALFWRGFAVFEEKLHGFAVLKFSRGFGFSLFTASVCGFSSNSGRFCSFHAYILTVLRF